MGRPTSADAAARPSGARVPHAPHRPKATYRFQLTQRANTTRAHVCELHGDSALRGDARHGPFPELVVCDLAPQAQAAVDASDDRQDRHEAAHVRVPGVRQAVVQQGLGHRDRAVAGRPGAGTRGRHRAAWATRSVGQHSGTHPARVSPAAAGGGAQPGVDVRAHEPAPLAQPVQRAQQRHRLLCQRAAVRGRQGRLRPGPPPRHGVCKTGRRRCRACLRPGVPQRRRGARAQPTSEQRRVRGAGGEQAAQEAEQLLHKALHVLRPLGQVPRWQHCTEQVHRQDLRKTPAHASGTTRFYLLVIFCP